MNNRKTILFEIPMEELKSLISEAIKTELDKFPILNLQSESSELISRKEAAKMLKISLPTLSDYVMRSIIPAYRIGNSIRLKKCEVVNALERIQAIKYK
jgi:excisionase family DNA binding protein